MTLAVNRSMQTTRVGMGLDVPSGFNPIPLNQVRNMFNVLPKRSLMRVFLAFALESGGRLEALSQLKGINIKGNILIYRETKNNKTRKVKLTPKFIEELNEYKYQNDIIHGSLFKCQYKWIQRQFNDLIRKRLDSTWQEWDPNNISDGAVKYRRKYTVRGLRTTIATLVYYYYKKMYGDSMALSRTSMWLGHRSIHMTGDYYVKNIEMLGIEDWPELPLPQLIDYIMYHSYQTHIEEYDRQASMMEF